MVVFYVPDKSKLIPMTREKKQSDPLTRAEVCRQMKKLPVAAEGVVLLPFLGGVESSTLVIE